MDDDLNVAAAWAAVFDWVRDTNKRLADNSLSALQAAAALAAWDRVNSVLGLGQTRNLSIHLTDKVSLGDSVSAALEAGIPADIADLFANRQAARKAKDFKRSDEIRDELKAKGWIIEDSPKGPKLKKV